MFLLNQKVIFLFHFLFIILLIQCKQSKIDLSKISDYKEFNIQATKASCRKVRDCFGYIYRTFPEEVAKKSSLEECENSVLRDIDSKIEKHDLKIQSLARICYTAILSSDCKTLPLLIVTDPNCSLLRSEIKKIN